MIFLKVPAGTKVAGITCKAPPPPKQDAGKPHPVGNPPNVTEAKKHVQKMLCRIGAAHDSGQGKLARQLGRLYLSSFAARYLAVLEAAKRLPQHVTTDASTLLSCAEYLNAWNGSQEEVLIRLLKKPEKPDSFRTILEFGLEHRALQALVLPLLKSQARLHPDQYMMWGVHVAIRKVARRLVEGNVWAIETDIHKCYPSFDGEKVPDLLPIPKEVTRQVLLSDTYHLLLGSGIFGPADAGEDDEITFAELFADARRGLPQGSAASPLVAEMLLAPLFHSLPTGGMWIGYADNCLAMGKSGSDVVSMTEALWSALKAHPAGQLRPNKPRVYTPLGPIEFLGHSLRLLNGLVRIDPTLENLEDFEVKLETSLLTIKTAPSTTVRTREVKKLQRYVPLSWSGAF